MVRLPLASVVRALLCAALVAAPALLGAGCVGGRCPPGTVYTEGGCFPEQKAGDGGLRDRGLPADGRRDGRSDGGPLEDHLGQTCTQHFQCVGKADFCMALQGQASGYCTYQGCSTAKNDCPEPYRCLDLSQYLITLPTACVKM
ncbi:MAG: hypothetical protein IT371_31640 [Deltaproteobacteria bacterium]|nr:hypothetical protein [Deltaproteobacteria bacterium]